MKVAIITAIISREFEDMPEKQLEGVMSSYLKMEYIPFCERIEKVKVSSQNVCAHRDPRESP